VRTALTDKNRANTEQSLTSRLTNNGVILKTSLSSQLTVIVTITADTASLKRRPSDKSQRAYLAKAHKTKLRQTTISLSIQTATAANAGNADEFPTCKKRRRISNTVPLVQWRESIHSRTLRHRVYPQRQETMLFAYFSSQNCRHNIDTTRTAHRRNRSPICTSYLSQMILYHVQNARVQTHTRARSHSCTEFTQKVTQHSFLARVDHHVYTQVTGFLQLKPCKDFQRLFLQ